MLLTNYVNVTNITSVLPQKYNPLSTTTVALSNAQLSTRKLLMQGSLVVVNGSSIVSGPNLCLYQVVNIVQFMKMSEDGIIAYYEELLAQPINIMIYAESNAQIVSSTISTTIFTLYANSSNFTNTIVNTTASSCLTNLGAGKGLEAQMSNKEYCSSGGSSAGYGTLSNS